MKAAEEIIDFYKKKNLNIPSCFQWGTAHVDVMKVDTLKKRSEAISLLSFSRKNLYKIKLVQGKCKCHYADKTIEIEQYALVFVHPMVPFLLEEMQVPIKEYFCVFNDDFFSNFGNIKTYPVFQDHQFSVLSLSEKEYLEFETILDSMKSELSSDYEYRFDAVRNHIYALIHKALKMNGGYPKTVKMNGADSRITILFEELLALQFPLHAPSDHVKLRKPKDFAEQLSISINHLNKAVKCIRNRTTSEIITDRVLQEAKILLKITDWSASEIAYALGYETPSRFTYTFHKNVGMPPLAYRNENIR
ncbi:helix-turn-helix transcriptional regulator [Olivibacter sp. SDN3]|uniref:helix-turn-helix domain-containing protein n=1 Tax=Olivibacter sp. SDN3 TaxID=2764720 RepID=UPI001650D913|nr:helix-turn-helix transcriptional regulator [Olivibacter sp. SDN3]QNL48059.1 helix-turn-helix transcriptional regulator [Olivibacter sp. SDN3]